MGNSDKKNLQPSSAFTEQVIDEVDVTQCIDMMEANSLVISNTQEKKEKNNKDTLLSTNDKKKIKTETFVSKGLQINMPLCNDSPLEGLVLYEPVDVNLLQKCMNSTLIVEKYEDEKWFSNERTQLEHYSNNIVKNLARVKYTRPQGVSIGRVNPKGSLGLHSLTRKTRHSIVKNVMTDIDMENCQPKLLLQILKFNNYKGSFKMLEEYCNNREAFRSIIINAFKLKENKKVKAKEMTEKSMAKQLIIRLMFGGSIAKWKTDNDIKTSFIPKEIKGLEKEITSIQQFICDSNPEIYEWCESRNLEKGKDYNLKGTTCSHFLQQKECMVLEVVYQYCVDNDYIKDDKCALCNDGIMIETVNYKPELLTELEVEVQKELGFNMVFVEKELDEDYLDILDDNLKFDIWKQPITDGLYANYFKLLYHNKFLFRHKYSYFYNGVYWEKDENHQNSRIASQIDNNFRTYILKRAFALNKKVDADLKEYKTKKEKCFLRKNKRKIWSKSS